MGRRGTLRTGDVSGDDQSEDAEKRGESSEAETYEVGHNVWKNSFGAEEGKTGDLFVSESGESGVVDLTGVEEEEEEETDSESSKERIGISDANDNPKRPAPSKKQRIIKPPRAPPAHLRIFDTDYYIIYNATLQNQGPAVDGPFRNYHQFDGHALYINPDLKATELDQIPHSGVRLDDLTASKVLSHFDCKVLCTRWLAEFDLQGMIRATRMPLGRAAKIWVNRGERGVDGRLVEREGWYYLSWGGIHTLMGKEGLDAGRYMIRPSHESFKCPGLGFKVSDWAEVQLAPEDPADPTFL